MKIFVVTVLLILLTSVAMANMWLNARIIDLDKHSDAICVKYKNVVYEITPVVSGDYLKLRLERVEVK